MTNKEVYEFAVWLHNTYEQVSKKKNWKTQEKCQVIFDDLPKENKRVMLEVSRRILKKLELNMPCLEGL